MATRQSEWQYRHELQGLCRNCSRPATDGRYCEAHGKRIRDYNRNRYRERHGIPIGAHTPEPPTSDPESVLQAKIVRWAKEHGYPIQSNRQTRNARGLLTPGWPDVCLIMRGRVVWVELKSGAGRLSEEQKQLRIAFLHLGHEIHEVRTWKRFLEIAGKEV